MSDIIITLDTRLMTQPLRFVWRWFAHLVAAAAEAVFGLISFRWLTVLSGVLIITSVMTVVVYQFPETAVAQPVLAASQTSVEMEQLRIADIVGTVTQYDQDPAGATVFPHSKLYQLEAGLLQSAEGVLLVAGWRHPLRPTLATAQLGQELTLVGQNNGNYSVTVIGIQNSERRLLFNEVDRSTADVIIAVPSSVLQTEFRILSGRYSR